MSEVIPEPVVLPCGCFIKCDIVKGVKQIEIVPCNATCLNYRNALQMAEEKALPIEYRRAP